MGFRSRSSRAQSTRVLSGLNLRIDPFHVTWDYAIVYGIGHVGRQLRRCLSRVVL